MKTSVKIVSLFLAILMIAMSLPMMAFAAKKETYVKELRISTASTAEEAKKWLTDNGYTVVDVDLNQKSGKDYVYVGYTTTTNPDEAITDISLMQMDGGYSFSEYEALLEQKKNEINNILNSLNTCLTEARENYAAGKTEATSAVKILNMFKEDDSDKFLGDFLMDSQTSRDDIIKVFLQGNSDITVMIYSTLAMACTSIDATENWIEKLKSVDPYEEYDELTYSDTADFMFESFVSINEILVEYKEKFKNTVENLEFSDNTDNLVDNSNSESLPADSSMGTALYTYLEMIPYKYNGGTTLLDFFLQDPDEIDTDEFYPILSAMTPGQRAIAEFVGFQNLITFGMSDTEAIEKYTTAVINSFEYNEIDKGVSVYFGVDRSLFSGGGVALSSDAMRKSASTGDNSWFSNDNIAAETRRLLNIISLTALGMAVATPILGAASKVIINKTVGRALLNSTYARMCNFYQVPTEVFRGMTTEPQFIINQLQEGARLEASKAYRAFSKTLTKRILVVGGVIMGLAMAVSLIAEGIKIGIKIYNFYHPEYSVIPRVIVDEVLTDTDSYYVNYYAVLDQSGQSGDLNAWSAQRWNALYTTTDKKAGDPIIASSFEVKLRNSDFPSDEHGAVHYFGEKAAANVNRYHFKKTATATYIFYKRDHSLSMAASTFSGGQLVMFTGFGLLGGVVIGSLSTFGADKLKKKKEAA